MEELLKLLIKQVGLYHLGAVIIYLWNKLLGRKKTYREIIEDEDYFNGVFLYWMGLIFMMGVVVLIFYLSERRII